MNALDKFKTYPEFDEYSELINRLDPGGPPQIRIIHHTTNPISESGKRLGIFSGSFNPMTIAHTKMVKKARKQYQLDEMLLLLAKANVDKDVFGLSLAERALTLKCFAETQNNISIGVSSHGRYIDKVAALQSSYPTGTKFFFIVGFDTLVRIFDPKYYTDFPAELEQLFSQCRFIAANRDSVDIKTIQNYLSQTSIQPYGEFIDLLLLPDEYADISSTEVRQRIKKGESISHLVPSIVADFLV